MVMQHMSDMLHIGILNPCIAVCERRIGSHQALLLQAQDDKIEDQDTECQDAAVQYPELTDIMGQEIWDDQVLPNTPATGYQQYVKAQRHRIQGTTTHAATIMHSIGLLITHARCLHATHA